MKYKTDTLVTQLAAGIDVDKILENLHLTATQAILMLKAKRGRRQLAARRRLATIHALLVAHRFSSYAVHRLCELLHNEKPDLRLKGAISVLNISGLSRLRVHRKPALKSLIQGDLPEPQSLEDLELLDAIAEVMHRKHQAFDAGHPESSTPPQP